MTVQYGVVRLEGAWTILGEGLRYGAYPTQRAAEDAALRLAALSAGLAVDLHVQQETGELSPPRRLPADE